MATQGERITSVEVEVHHLRRELSQLRGELRSSNEKLDKLLALQHKGAGAFILASSLFGTGIVGVVTTALGWWK